MSFNMTFVPTIVTCKWKKNLKSLKICKIFEGKENVTKGTKHVRIPHILCTIPHIIRTFYNYLVF